MIRVVLEVEQYGHIYRVEREDLYETDGGQVTDRLGTLIRAAQASMTAALKAVPER